MAGRQKHSKRTYDLSSPIRYKGKMRALFAQYMGDDYAKELASAMLKEYEDTSVSLYTSVRNSNELRDYLDSHIGSALQFLAFQLVNETISSVLLTRNETASMVYYKYNQQGLPSDDILNIMAITANLLGSRIPAYTASTKGEKVTAGTVVKTLDSYVMNAPPAPRSYGGKASAKEYAVVPSTYAGTQGFGSYSSVTTALEDIKNTVSKLV